MPSDKRRPAAGQKHISDPDVRVVLPYLRSHLTLLLHLVKAQYDPSHFNRHGWRASSIRNQRAEISRLMRVARVMWNAPDLYPYLEGILPVVYSEARQLAIAETGLAASAFPAVCPWLIIKILGQDFLGGD